MISFPPFHVAYAVSNLLERNASSVPAHSQGGDFGGSFVVLVAKIGAPISQMGYFTANTTEKLSKFVLNALESATGVAEPGCGVGGDRDRYMDSDQ